MIIGKKKKKSSVVAHACVLSTEKAEEGGLQV